MSGAPQHDPALELLLQEIARTIGENQRFLQALKQDRIDADDEATAEQVEEDEFEEL